MFRVWWKSGRLTYGKPLCGHWIKKKKSKHILYYKNTGNFVCIGDESRTNRKTNDGILNTHSTRENNFARNHILKKIQ